MGRLFLLAREGVETRDGRLIPPGELWWEDRPLPVFRWLSSDDGGPTGDHIIVNALDRIWRVGDNVWGTLAAHVDRACRPGLDLDATLDLPLVGLDAPVVILRGCRIMGAHLDPAETWPWT